MVLIRFSENFVVVVVVAVVVVNVKEYRIRNCCLFSLYIICPFF